VLPGHFEKYVHEPGRSLPNGWILGSAIIGMIADDWRTNMTGGRIIFRHAPTAVSTVLQNLSGDAALP
jgi:hypothetical protein